MYTMQKTLQSYSPETGGTTFHILPVAVCKVGDGHLGVVHSWEWASQVIHCRD